MSCVHCGILEAKVKLLNDECAKLSTESTSETCRRQHIQLCFKCKDIDCCDNMSPMKERLRGLDALDADHSRLYRENIWLRHELVKKTGCTLEEIDECMKAPVHKPVVNRRMGEAMQARFRAEDEVAVLRATTKLRGES